MKARQPTIIGTRKPSKWLFRLLGVSLFLTLWQLLCFAAKDPALVGVHKIFVSALSILSRAGFYANLFSTLKIILFGILISVALGIPAACAMTYSRRVNFMIEPLLEALRNIPSIALFPLLLVIYGIDDAARIAIIVINSLPSIILTALHGLRTVDRSVVEAALNSGASDFQTLLRIKLPLATSEILNGIKISAGNGFVAVSVAEMLGASKGLGFMILWSTNAFKYNETYAYIFLLALTGAAMNYALGVVINLLEERFL